MSKYFTSVLILGACLSYSNSFSQSNTFPTTGKVGIGTIAPSDFLEIQTGNQRKGISIRSDGDGSAYSDIVFHANKSETIPTGALSHGGLVIVKMDIFQVQQKDSPWNFTQIGKVEDILHP